MIFELTPKQMEARDAVLQVPGVRHSLLYGGARSTKTFLICFAIASRAIDAPNSRHLISRLHHIDVKQKVMLDTWPKMMGLAYHDQTYALNRSDQLVTFPNGAEVWFGGLDDGPRRDKVLGGEYASIFFNECSQISFDTITTLRTRLAQNVRRRDGRILPLRAYYDLNPVGRMHWTYKEFVQGVDPLSGQPTVDTGIRRHLVMNPADNPHLPPETLEELAALPTRQRARFFEGKYLSEVPGALWSLDGIEALRVVEAPQLQRVVVAVDPSGGDGAGNDAQGIIVAGLGVDGDAYVLADRTCRLTPAGWAKACVNAYDEFGADKLVAEVNYGGAMVESTIRMAKANVAYKDVNASRGKHVRAEPVAALYEDVRDKAGQVIRAGRVHHVGHFPELEEELGLFTTHGYQGGNSPNRADALVWAITELMLGIKEQGWLDYARQQLEAKRLARERA